MDERESRQSTFSLLFGQSVDLIISAMVSRKKAAGKARKVAKAKAEEEAQQQAPEAQMQQLVRNAPIAGCDTTTKCWHGFGPLYSNDNWDSCSELSALHMQRLKVPRLINLPTYGKILPSWKSLYQSFLSMGVLGILEGRYSGARKNAAISRYLADYIAADLKQTQALINWPKIREVHKAELHTLVKFYRKRISCSCLEKKYQEVKTITKMGYCYNPQCEFLNGQVERSKTFYCSRCRLAIYCSRGCQKAHWRTHQIACDHYDVVVAKFEARQQDI
eukprot:scaffold586_cov112-Skeletonema_dohrnii-CCMP3373.AAC.3